MNRKISVIVGILGICLILSALLPMAACSQSEPAPTPAPAPAPAPTPTPAPVKTYEWKLQAHMPEQVPAVGENINTFIKMVEQNTSGRIKITRYPVEAIVPSADLFKSTADGVIQMSTSPGQWWKGIMPIASVEEALPGTWTTGLEQDSVMLDYGLLDLLRGEYAKHGIYLLTEYSNNPTQQGLTMTQPVANLAEFRGKKIRAIGSVSDWVADLEGTPVPTPFADMYSALSTGVLDGAITPWDAMASNKLYEPAPYLILPTIAGAPGLNIMLTMDEWNALTDDLKMILQLTADKWASWVSRYYSPKYMPDLAAMEATGFKAVYWEDPADLAKIKEVGTRIWDKLAESDPKAAEAVGILKDYFKK
jgi:TRAP-type C4-dicarboxylate transport system substrate-binding protein